MNKNILIHRLIETPLHKLPKKIAIIDENGSYSYELLEKKSNLLAAYFQQERLQHERIAVLLPNSFELICIYLACFKAGVILVPLEFRDAPEETLHVYDNAKPKWLIIHEDKLVDLGSIAIEKTSIKKIWGVGSCVPLPYENFNDLFDNGGFTKSHSFSKIFASKFRDFVSTYALKIFQKITPKIANFSKQNEFKKNSNKPTFQKREFLPSVYSFLLYTSGSTGLPKGVIYSYSSASAMIQSVLDALPSIASDSTLVVHDSNSHIDGLLQVLPQLYMGGTVILRKSFLVKDFYKNLRRYRPSVIGAHINHLVEIIEYPHLEREDFASVKQIFTGGDELPLKLQQQFLDKTGLFVQVGYGMTESIWLTITHKPYLNKRGAIGKPVNDQIQLRLVDKSGTDVDLGKIGEIWVQAPMNTPGYWDDPFATRSVFENKWFKTGDCAYQDEEGNYWFVGRVKQIIERNSENITPFEVEQAIGSHPAVKFVGVIGRLDAKEGEVPVAYVVLKEGTNLNEEELKLFLKKKIAEYKIPVQIYFVTSLPMTKSNKINREFLKTMSDKTLR